MNSLHQGSFQLAVSGGATLAPRGALTFDTAGAALRQLQAASVDGAVCVLDLAGIEHCDSAGLACVLAFAADVQRRGQALKLRHVPTAMRTLAEVCEVGDWLA